MPKTNSDDLSAFVDGELSASETRFFARRLSHDDALRDQWHRMHLVRDCMQGSGAHGLDLRQRVQEAIEAEPALTGAPASPARWLRPVAGMAVAATVAVATLMALREPGMPANETQQLVDAQYIQPINGNEDVVLVPTATPAVSNVSLGNQQSRRDMRLRQYLLRHNEQAALNRRSGFVNYIYLASPPQQVEQTRDEATATPPDAQPAGGSD